MHVRLRPAASCRGREATAGCGPTAPDTLRERLRRARTAVWGHLRSPSGVPGAVPARMSHGVPCAELLLHGSAPASQGRPDPGPDAVGVLLEGSGPETTQGGTHDGSSSGTKRRPCRPASSPGRNPGPTGQPRAASSAGLPDTDRGGGTGPRARSTAAAPSASPPSSLLAFSPQCFPLLPDAVQATGGAGAPGRGSHAPKLASPAPQQETSRPRQARRTSSAPRRSCRQRPHPAPGSLPGSPVVPCGRSSAHQWATVLDN